MLIKNNIRGVDMFLLLLSAKLQAPKDYMSALQKGGG